MYGINIFVQTWCYSCRNCPISHISALYCFEKEHDVAALDWVVLSTVVSNIWCILRFSKCFITIEKQYFVTLVAIYFWFYVFFFLCSQRMRGGSDGWRKDHPVSWLPRGVPGWTDLLLAHPRAAGPEGPPSVSGVWRGRRHLVPGRLPGSVRQLRRCLGLRREVRITPKQHPKATITCIKYNLRQSVK